MKLTIRPLTPDLWPALEDLFGERGAVGGCWCMYWRIGNAYRKRPGEKNKADFRAVVKRGPPPGLLAFDGALAVGWCQLTPRDGRAVARPHMAAEAGGRSPGLVDLLPLCPQGLSAAGRHRRLDRRRARKRRGGRRRRRSKPIPSMPRSRRAPRAPAMPRPSPGPDSRPWRAGLSPPDHAPRPEVPLSGRYSAATCAAFDDFVGALWKLPSFMIASSRFLSRRMLTSAKGLPSTRRRSAR